VQVTANLTAGADQLELTVVDSGIGMNAEQLQRLFQPFTQADPSTTRKYGGTGLGLTISKHFAEMMGGEIGVASTFNKGSVFTVRLPLHAPRTLPPSKPTLPRLDRAGSSPGLPQST
jgi:signal transduction histidine kinase